MGEPVLRGLRGWTPEVREPIYEHIFGSPDREVGGVLVGEVADSETVVLRGSIQALDAPGAPDSVTFTHDTWQEIHRVVDRDYPDLKLVGWYHSHPGLGIFLSRNDEFIHRSFFDEWWQVAFVVDPIEGREGMFGWRKGRLKSLGQKDTPRPGLVQ